MFKLLLTVGSVATASKSYAEMDQLPEDVALMLWNGDVTMAQLEDKCQLGEKGFFSFVSHAAHSVSHAVSSVAHKVEHAAVSVEHGIAHVASNEFHAMEHATEKLASGAENLAKKAVAEAGSLAKKFGGAALKEGKFLISKLKGISKFGKFFVSPQFKKDAVKGTKFAWEATKFMVKWCPRLT